MAVVGTNGPNASTGSGGTQGGATTDSANAQCNINTNASGAWLSSSKNIRMTNRAGATLGGINTCISRFGVHDMIGNVAEMTGLNGISGGQVVGFVQDQINNSGGPFNIIEQSRNINSSTIGCDGTSDVVGTCSRKDNVAAIAVRGGYWNDASDAGALALNLDYSGSISHWGIGFRCAQLR